MTVGGNWIGISLTSYTSLSLSYLDLSCLMTDKKSVATPINIVLKCEGLLPPNYDEHIILSFTLHDEIFLLATRERRLGEIKAIAEKMSSLTGYVWDNRPLEGWAYNLQVKSDWAENEAFLEE